MQTSIKLRSGYRLDLDEYDLPGKSCFWFEMDHKFEKVPETPIPAKIPTNACASR